MLEYAQMSEIFRNTIDNGFRRAVYPYLVHGDAQADREIAHERALTLMEQFQKVPCAVKVLGDIFSYQDPILHTTFAGLTAQNPLGIAAGFDKNARVHNFIGEGLGFGSVTVGSITKVAYEGNPRPRIFELSKSNAIINRMGFPGEGSESAVSRLRKDDPKGRRHLLIVNFAASKPSFESGRQIEDYVDVAKDLVPFGDEGEGNVSSPNTTGVRGLQEPEIFTDMVQAVSPVYEAASKPLRWKFGPDLGAEKLVLNAGTIIDNAGAGITITNTTTDSQIRESLDKSDHHKGEMGGISGSPLTQKALETSHNLHTEIGEVLPIHRIGGIMNSKDLWDALTYGGATTVDIYSAFVKPDTSTPNLAYYLLRDLAESMRKLGITSMTEFKNLRGKRVDFPLS